MAKEIKVKKIPEGLSGITGRISKRKDTKKVRPRGFGGHPGKPFRKAGGMVKKMAGGSLKEVSSDKKGLAKLPKKVRGKMGYKKAGGMVKKMGGGQVYNRGKGGKVIKSSNNGDQVIAGCYD